MEVSAFLAVLVLPVLLVSGLRPVAAPVAAAAVLAGACRLTWHARGVRLG
ncbi:hypothetical protein [Streptomyces mashuensis]|nr:hypothetical protein [Streptomyces mashuensis]